MGIRTGNRNAAKSVPTPSGLGSLSVAVLDPEPVESATVEAAPVVVDVPTAPPAAPTAQLELPDLGSIDEVIHSLEQLPGLLENATTEQRRELRAHYEQSIESNLDADFGRLLAPDRATGNDPIRLREAHNALLRMEELRSIISPLRAQAEECKLPDHSRVNPEFLNQYLQLQKQIQHYEFGELSDLLHDVQWGSRKNPYDRMRKLRADYLRGAGILSRTVVGLIGGANRPQDLERALAEWHGTLQRIRTQVNAKVPKREWSKPTWDDEGSD